MYALTVVFIVVIVVMAILIGWSYTKSGKRWLDNL